MIMNIYVFQYGESDVLGDMCFIVSYCGSSWDLHKFDELCGSSHGETIEGEHSDLLS